MKIEASSLKREVLVASTWSRRHCLAESGSVDDGVFRPSGIERDDVGALLSSFRLVLDGPGKGLDTWISHALAEGAGSLDGVRVYASERVECARFAGSQTIVSDLRRHVVLRAVLVSGNDVATFDAPHFVVDALSRSPPQYDALRKWLPAVGEWRASERSSKGASPEGGVRHLPTPVRVVVAPGQSAYLAHELLGHLLEADTHAALGPALAAAFEIGAFLIPSGLTVRDGPPAVADDLGIGRFDDGGFPAVSSTLVESGRVNALLGPGAYRRESIRHRPLPRMRHTVVEAPQSLAARDEGVVMSVRKILHGSVNAITGQFRLLCGTSELLDEGAVIATTPACFIEGAVKELLATLGCDGEKSGTIHGTCVKAGQAVPVMMTAPALGFSTSRLSISFC